MAVAAWLNQDLVYAESNQMCLEVVSADSLPACLRTLEPLLCMADGSINYTLKHAEATQHPHVLRYVAICFPAIG